MGKIIERTFSGYRLNLPKRLKLFVYDGHSEQRIQIKNDFMFWMTTRFSYYTQLFEQKGLDGFK